MIRLISAGAVALTLCTAAPVGAQGLGAAPATYWEDLAIIGAIKGVRPCALAGDSALRVVVARYAGVPMSKAMARTSWPTERQIVKEVYAMPRMATTTYRATQATEMRETVERACYEVMGDSG